MGFWLDMVFGKSPLQSEVDEVHRKVETSLKAIGSYNEDHAKYALASANEIEKLKARVDLLEADVSLLNANVTIHKRSKNYKGVTS